MLCSARGSSLAARVVVERAPEFRARYNTLDAVRRADILRALSPERSREPVLRHLALGLTDPSALVRSVALTAFGFNRESEFEDLFPSEPWVEQLFTAAARTALESLIHPDGHLRWAAARALRMPGRFIAVHMGEIVRLTRSPQRKERREGVFVLDRLFWEGRFGAERAFDPPTPAPDHLLPHLATIEAVLTERSKDEDPTVRLVVADVFAAMGRLAVRNLGVVRSLRADTDERVPPVLPQDRPAVVAFLEKYDLSALVALRLIAREGRSAVWAMPEIRRLARAYFAPAGPEEPVDIKAELTEEARRLLALLEAR